MPQRLISRTQHRRRDDDMPGSEIPHPEDRARSFVLYGRSGTGKTTLTSTFPKPLLLMDLRDEGTDSIADVKGITLRQINSVDDYEDMLQWLRKHPTKFKTVVTDTVSQLQQMVMDDLTKDSKRKGRPGDWGTMTRKEFGAISGMMKDLLIDYRDLTQEGMNVVFVAQDREFSGEDEDRGGVGEIDPEVGPALMPSVAKTLNAAVSVIGNTLIRARRTEKEVRGKKVKKEVMEFCLRVGPNPVYVTKVRKPKGTEAPSLIVNPTYSDLLEIIKGD